jgi:hypothetical protein
MALLYTHRSDSLLGVWQEGVRGNCVEFCNGHFVICDVSTVTLWNMSWVGHAACRRQIINACNDDDDDSNNNNNNNNKIKIILGKTFKPLIN